MSKLKVLDLFSGIGGFSLGLERTGGFETVAFCEIEPYCRKVLAKHWPDVRCYDDVRTLTADALARDGIVVDAICGGFPCQDISFAGKGAGIDGERSGLWSENARLIGELRPRIVIVENVSALLGRGLARVLGDLAALGYDAEWHCIRAADVGAPHLRDRLWIVAFPQDPDADGESQRIGAFDAEMAGASQPVADAAGDGWGERIADGRGRGAGNGEARPAARRPGNGSKDVADAGGQRGAGRRASGDMAGATGTREAQGEEWQRHGDAADDRRADVADAGIEGLPLSERDTLLGARWWQEGRATGERSKSLANTYGRPLFGSAIAWEECDPWLPESGFCRVAHGVPARVDRLRALGNAVVPQIPELIGRAILAARVAA